MQIERYTCGSLASNCYVVNCGGRYAVIDVGFPTGAAIYRIAELRDKIDWILVTHRHFDHVMGVAAAKRLTGAKVAVHRLEACGLLDEEKSLYSRFRRTPGVQNETCEPDLLLEDGDTVTVGDCTFKVLLTPGHTEGSVCFLCGDTLFSGDTLFAGAVGRTDFPTGSMEQMMHSLDRLALLGDGTVVYPGHGEDTTIGREKQCNPYMKR
jgi:glyoxylase-like metal-dependent hydrolase (beta-lactamase superfamily II)